MKITINNINDVFKSKAISIETMQYKGYELVTELFCDSSGLGADNEMALTKSQLIEKLNHLLNEYKTIYTTITNQGQFQIYLGIFIKTKKTIQSKKIDNNTLEIIDGDKKIIRLYDTDILTIENGILTLSSGGFQTHTTKARLNKYLADYNLYITQKDFNWFVKSNLENTNIDFSDGMTLSI